jgi:hypothetical protein
LNDIVKRFKLQPGKYENQKLLPTTLAALTYIEIPENAEVETVWAGDSRCYAITAQGLKQLTIDDEDAAETITNLFYAGSSKHTTLNYKKYAVPLPCILLTVSDGVFDPYSPDDNLGVEATLLDNIKNSQSIEELREKLEKHYDKVHADDATMSFVALGFDSYAQIQEVLAPRTEEVMDIWAKYHKMKALLGMVNCQDTADDIVGKIKARTTDRIEKIAELLTDAYCNNKKDIVLSDEIRPIIAAIEEKLKKELTCQKEEQKTNVLGMLRKRITENYSEIEKSILSSGIGTINSKKLTNALEDFRNAAADLTHIKDAYDKMCRDQKDADNEGAEIIEKITKYRDEIHKKLSTADSTPTINDLAGEYHELCKIQCHYLEGKVKMYSTKSLSEDIRQLGIRIDNILEKRFQNTKDIDEKKKCLDAKTGQYEKVVKALFAFENDLIQNAASIFTPKIVTDYGLDLDKQGSVSDVGTITRELLGEFRRNPETIELIVAALANNYNETSVIDSCYQATRLGSFREYYRLKATSSVSTDVEEFKAELEMFMAEYESLLTMD